MCSGFSTRMCAVDIQELSYFHGHWSHARCLVLIRNCQKVILRERPFPPSSPPNSKMTPHLYWYPRVQLPHRGTYLPYLPATRD